MRLIPFFSAATWKFINRPTLYQTSARCTAIPHPIVFSVMTFIFERNSSRSCIWFFLHLSASLRLRGSTDSFSDHFQRSFIPVENPTTTNSFLHLSASPRCKIPHTRPKPHQLLLLCQIISTSSAFISCHQSSNSSFEI